MPQWTLFITDPAFADIRNLPQKERAQVLANIYLIRDTLNGDLPRETLQDRIFKKQGHGLVKTRNKDIYFSEHKTSRTLIIKRILPQSP